MHRLGIAAATFVNALVLAIALVIAFAQPMDAALAPTSYTYNSAEDTCGHTALAASRDSVSMMGQAAPRSLSRTVERREPVLLSDNCVAAKPAIGFAEGLGETALTPGACNTEARTS